MVNLIGEKIKNKALGVGTIISVEGKYITIEFPSKISKFTYPMAFENSWFRWTQRYQKLLTRN